MSDKQDDGNILLWCWLAGMIFAAMICAIIKHVRAVWIIN